LVVVDRLAEGERSMLARRS